MLGFSALLPTEWSNFSFFQSLWPPKNNKGKVISPSAYWRNYSDNVHRIDLGIFQPFLEFHYKSTDWTPQKNSPQNFLRFAKRNKKATKLIIILWFDLLSPKKSPVFPPPKTKEGHSKKTVCPNQSPHLMLFLRIFPSHLRESVFTGTRPAVKTVSRGDWSFFSVECSDPGYP